MSKIKGILSGALAASLVCGIAGAQAPRSNDAALSRNLNTFNAIVKELQLNYVDSLDSEKSLRTAIDAMLSTVDPYTEYYNSEDQEKLQKLTTGEFAGIGSYIMQREGKSYISQPMEGSPAAIAGLRAGDHILRIDTTDVSSTGSDKVSGMLRGTAGTNVRVTVCRPYVADSIITVNIERRKIQEPSVPYSAVIGKTGYIRLTQFIDKSGREVQDALEAFKNNGNVENIVLDLRGNGGGLVESAVDIVSNFVPKGTEVFRMKYKDPSQEKIYKTTRNPIFPDIPLAVLIDGGTASASEITAGSLQDLDRAILVGSRSYGKGLVQSTRPLPYSGVLKVTVAKYYIPSGRLIQALDWSHRNPDGSAARVPDSLTNVFKTLHGREVRDGGGLRPDSTIDWGNINRLVYNAVSDNWVFDFATRYAAEHPVIPPAEEFTVTDTIYSEFKKSIDPEKFKYDKVCEEMVKQLRETAEQEGYMNDETRAQLDTLARLLTHNLDRDLDLHRKDIEEYLGSEIVSRYYYDRGKAAYEIKDDKAFRDAVSIMEHPEEYKRILGLQTPKQKKAATPKAAKQAKKKK